jgi:protochlorophyllide reductase
MMASLLIFVANFSVVTAWSANHHNINHNDKNIDPTNAARLPQRRDLLRTASALVLAPATLLLPTNNHDYLAVAADENDQPFSTPPSGRVGPRTYVITGATSGIGMEACKLLARNNGPQDTIVLVGRTLQRAQEAVEIVRQATTAGSTNTAQLVPAECDLASLRSIDQFVNVFLARQQQSPIDTLCLNAGLSRNTNAQDCRRTTDGYELTVGVNHFGHYYLTRLLLPRLNRESGRIVVTASGVHDPESPGGAQGETATLGNLAGLERLGRDCEMIDGGSFNADKAYKDSKVRERC